LKQEKKGDSRNHLPHGKSERGWALEGPAKSLGRAPINYPFCVPKEKEATWFMGGLRAPRPRTPSRKKGGVVQLFFAKTSPSRRRRKRKDVVGFVEISLGKKKRKRDCHGHRRRRVRERETGPNWGKKK